MSWPMPTSGQWNPGMGMMPDMNVGNYTPDQWQAMQQQNWQQWNQWQQQYTQWQAQYGEKYAQQMYSMQAMGVPPLPSGAAPPPAPPPPDQPPPPLPHENNQPLFGKTTTNPTPVPPPAQQNNSGYTNQNLAGNNQNWAHNTPDPDQAAVDKEALKKLAEEERLFDIQFQKWEEEIEKWKEDNVNHPDKEAYKEYEAKFEACRAQLLERRQQMNQRRARLTGTTPSANAAPASQTGNNKSTAHIPPLMQTPVQPPYMHSLPNNQPMQSASKPPLIQTGGKQNYQQNTPSHNYNNYSNQNRGPPTHNQYNEQAPPLHNNERARASNNNERAQASHNNERAQVSHNRNNANCEPQDRYGSYQDMNEYSSDPYGSEKTAFLPPTGSSKTIPGLDLVPDSDKSANNQDCIDITDDYQNQPKAPDYSTISKGINNILGDEKIMNILSMVRGHFENEGKGNNQGGPSQNASLNSGPSGSNMPVGIGSHGPNNNNNYNMPPPSNNQWDRNQYNNQQQNNQQNMNMPFNRQGPPDQMQHPQQRMYNNGQGGMQQGGMPDQYQDRNNQFGGPNMCNRPPNMPPGRPPLQDMSAQQNMNAQHRGPIGGMPSAQNMPPNNVDVSQPPPKQWAEEPLFSASIIVDYEHKPLRLKAREFIDPVHMFDYNHISKDDQYKKKDFEKEVDGLFTRKPRRMDDEHQAERGDRFSREGSRFDSPRYDSPRDEIPRYEPPRYEPPRYEPSRSESARHEPSRDYERRPRPELRDDYRKIPFKDDEDRRRAVDSSGHFERRRDDRGYSRRDENRERDRERDRYRDSRDDRARDERRRSRSRDRDARKRGRSKESVLSDLSKKSKNSPENKFQDDRPKHVIMIDDILEEPGREMRPEKIVIILRGPPGSGKSYLAKLIRDREAEHGGAVRIMSIDDYFMQEGDTEEKDPITGRIVNKPTLKYEYDESLEEAYLTSLKRAFKRSITDGYFSFLIYDAINDQLKSYADIWNFARQNAFQVYICTMEMDAHVCHKRNIHNRSLDDIQIICSRFFPTPSHHLELDATTLLQSAAITDVTMEDVSDDVILVENEPEVENSFTSKWEKMDDAVKLARLDGTSKPLRPSQLSMEDYLQLDDWKPTTAKPGKKTVRWADIEERRQQEKMRAIGFVVGQTDWNRMTDPTMGSSALTQTKYIERVKRN